jgi:hypothetical protein
MATYKSKKLDLVNKKEKEQYAETQQKYELKKQKKKLYLPIQKVKLC